MLIYAVDIGTTNIKVVLFDEMLRRLAMAATPAVYDQVGDRVEFSADALFSSVIELIGRCHRDADPGRQNATIALTGQAESLVVLGSSGEPVFPGMSWLDDRAGREAAAICDHFDGDTAFAVTGQPAASPTWPAAKLLWLAQNEPKVMDGATSVLMIKDELIRRFTGEAFGEVSTRGFSYFYDVANRCYWPEMLDFIGISDSVLPQIVPAGTDLGPVRAEIADRLPPAVCYRVNAGALDHFCAMAGTDSYCPGIVSESAGTVLSLSLLTSGWTFDPGHKVSFHNGFGVDDIVLFSGVDSGGIALEWYRREGLADMAYSELERQLRARPPEGAPIFLPYLTGVNPPDYFTDARGAFLDLELGHTRIDLAFAVEEGIAHLLRRNVDYLSGGSIQQIVSTGGGSESSFFNQLKADVCDIDVVVPEEREATCRGAAVLALLAAGEIDSLADTGRLTRPAATRHRARTTADREDRYRRFDNYLKLLFARATRKVQ